MRRLFKPLLVLWPGSTGTFCYGLWSQLGIALLFGLICQAALFLVFYWSHFLSNFARLCVGFGVLVSWILLSAIASTRLKKYEKMRNTDSAGEAFLEAQSQYLRGNWFETECCLNNLLKRNPYDVEALLLLATLFRHLKRFTEARKTLAELEKIEASSVWREEIQFEKKAIVEDEKEELEEEGKDAPDKKKDKGEASKVEQEKDESSYSTSH